LPRKLLAAYVIAVHFALAVVLLKSDFIDRVRSKLALNTHATSAFHYEMVKYHQRIDSTVPDDSVVFIGDSHTQGIAVTAIVDNAVNYGIAGDTTINVLSRLPNYHISLGNAQLIVLQVGVNDLLRHRKPENVVEDFANILTSLPNKPVLVIGLMPVDEKVERFAGVNADVTVLNQKIKTLVNERPHTTFLETATAVGDDTGNLQAKYHLGDGLHLSPAGNQVWMKLIRSALQHHRVLNTS